MEVYLLRLDVAYLYLVTQKGELAQLGERLPCTQEVSSSILLFSTTLDICIVKKCILVLQKAIDQRLN